MLQTDLLGQALPPLQIIAVFLFCECVICAILCPSYFAQSNGFANLSCVHSMDFLVLVPAAFCGGGTQFDIVVHVRNLVLLDVPISTIQSLRPLQGHKR